MSSYKIAALPGDGTGPEVVAEGLKALERIASVYSLGFTFKEFDFGGDRFLRPGGSGDA